MRRVMSLWLPNWAIDRWRRQGSRKQRPFDDTPFVLAATIGNRRLVTAADAEAQAMGIAPGMALTDARALHPALAVAESDPARDRAALARLAAWCGRYSPWTAPHGGDGVWLDITGCAHLRGGESALAAELIERLARQGIAGRAAIADTPGAAWAMACGSGAATVVVPEGGARQALAALPVDALRLDPAAIAELGRLGLRRIGDLYAMPRAALAARFGERLAHRLDQALGLAAEPLSPLPPAPARWARRRFAEPIGTAEDIAAATRELLARLCRSLADEMLGARRLVLTLYRVDGTSETASIGTARPSRDPGHLLRLFEERLTTLDPGLGIEDMLLAAPMVETLAALQLGFAHRLQSARRSPSPPFRAEKGWDEVGGACRVWRVRAGARWLPPPHLTSPPPGAEREKKKGRRNLDTLDDTSLAMLVDRLANRLGSAALGCFVPRESHLPERSSHFAPVFAPAAVAAWEKPWQRPIRLLPRPEPVEAVAPVPDDPPVRFRWRRVMHRVRRADGPERIVGEWWRGAADAAELRDYYCVEDETGRRFWLYRAGLYRPEMAPRWFLHGLFA